MCAVELKCTSSFSYCDQNLMSHSRYRKYSGNVPQFLINRPKNLVTHCMQKIAMAKEVDLSGIVMTDNGVFKITSFKDAKERYTVNFGDEHTMPHCACFNWKQSAFPCKHFFAVFRKFKQWNWDSLSPIYINSPYLTLDESIINQQHEEDELQQNSDNSQDEEIDQESNVNSDEEDDDCFEQNEEGEHVNDAIIQTENNNSTEGKGTSSTLLNFTRSQIKETLADIKQLIYLVDDYAEIKNLLVDLNHLKSNLNSKVSSEAGLPLIPKNIPNKITKRKKCKPKYLELPPRKKRKATHRIGQKAEEMKNATKIKVNPDKTNDTQTLIVEYAPSEGFGDEEFVITHDQIFDEIIEIDDDSDEITDHQSLPGRHNLNAGDLSAISNHRMLSDNVINAMQKMIATEYKNTNGLQDSVLGQTLNFKIYKSKPFVQVLHDGSLHWVTISTYGCEKGEVNLMDSMFKGAIALQTKRQICAIMHCEEEKIRIKVLPIQQQSNGVDCGVYAIAYALCIASEQDPSTISFEQVSMRNNILQSLKDNKLLPFKTNLKPVKRCKQKSIEMDIFCSCRMFWTSSDKWVYGR